MPSPETFVRRILDFVPYSATRLRIEILAIVALGALVLGAQMTRPPMVDWDEATYAEVSRGIVATGDWMNLSWDGEPYMKKPPLLFWMTAASFELFGVNEFAARLPSVLMGLGTLVLIYLGASAIAGRVAGTVAALIPLNFYFFVARGGRESATDAPLLFFTTLALYAFLKSLGSRRWLPVAGAATGLAIVSKGLAGLIAPAVAIVAVTIFAEFRAIGPSGLAIIGASAAAVAAPWFIYQASHDFALFFSTFVGQETLQRVASHLEDEPHGLSFTLRTFYSEVETLWPLLIPVPAMIVARVRRGLESGFTRIDPAIKLSIVWLVVALGAACAVRTRLPWYILPALPPVAILGGTLLGSALRQSGPLAGWSRAFACAAIAILAALTPIRMSIINDTFQAQRDRSMPAYLMALRARQMAVERGGGKLFFAGPALPTLVYYSEMRCHFVAPRVLEKIDLEPQGAAPPQIGFHDLFLVDPSGEATMVSNLEEEWVRFSSAGDPDSAPADTGLPDAGQ
jgi:4-amino-4-deoxy-L-arabinose transferase-like glycosyltransferase